MVWQREGLGFTYDDVAKNLCVDKSTVKRIVDRFNFSGNAEAAEGSFVWGGGHSSNIARAQRARNVLATPP